MRYDVAIIGAGVTGSFIARELSRYNLNVCLLEKEADVAMGTSKANSGIVHAGYDAEPGSLKAKLNVQGNRMMAQIAEELSVPFKRIGSLVLAFDDHDMAHVKALYQKGLANGVPAMEVIGKEQVKRMEPNLSQDVVGALYAPTGGIVCPYELTLGAAENAVANGVVLKLGCTVEDICMDKDKFRLMTSTGEIKCKYVINAAGVYADTIAGMIGDESFSIHPRKGEYLLLDKSQGDIVRTVVFQPPTKMGKGILVTPTVDGNLLVGPTAQNIDDKENVATTAAGLNQVVQGAGKSVPSFNVREVITSFAGLRATPSTDDFVIGPSTVSDKFINAAGIESPGLSAAPAIGDYAAGILKKSGLVLEQKENFTPIRKPVYRFREMKDEQRNEMIKRDPKYGKIICRCESVTEGEIVDCIHRPVGARNLDAVKRRTRAGMGRCQGGFCAPKIVEILSRELDIPMEEVTKMGGKSGILVGKTK